MILAAIRRFFRIVACAAISGGVVAATSGAESSIPPLAGAAENPQSVAAIAVAALTQPYNGAPRPVEVSTIPAGLKVRVTYNGVATAPVLPGKYRVTATVDDANFAGSVADILTVTVTALVRHAPENEGAIDGSVQVTSAENLLLDGRSSISGDLLVPGAPSLDLAGLPMVVGTVDANGIKETPPYTIYLREGAVLRYLVRRVDPLPIPVVVSAGRSEGTRDIAITDRPTGGIDWHDARDITAVADSASIFVPPGAYGRLTIAGGAPVVLGDSSGSTPAVYRFESIAVRDGAALRVAGPIVLVVAGSIDVDGTVGDAPHARWMTAAVASGGILLRPGASFAGLVLAPNGEVSIGTGARLTGQVVADRLRIDAEGVLADSTL